MQGPANVDAIGLLVELGADLWSVMKDVDMETPLHMASRSGRLDIVDKLLCCGADLNKKTKVSCLCTHHTVHFIRLQIAGMFCVDEPDLWPACSLCVGVMAPMYRTDCLQEYMVHSAELILMLSHSIQSVGLFSAAICLM